MNSSTPGPRLLSGRYLLGELLGRGGMGDVYRATDQVLARQVAVKVFRPDVSDDALHLRHQSEARVLAGLNHPGLVAVYDIGTQDEQPFLVMELVEGETLAQLIRRGPLEPRHAASLGGQLAASLQAIHDAGVIHRDVKPANVMVRAADDGTPWRTKLTDFGIARLVDGTRLTSTGLLLGTAQYLSPEQTIGETVSYPSDVYALGLVLLECLTGGPAFPGVGIETAVVRLTRQPEVPVALGGQWGALLAAMTAREPEDRPTAGEVAATLDGLTADARPRSAGFASVTPLVPIGHAAVVPAGHAPAVPAAPGLEPSGSPAAHDDAPTQVGEAPYPVGRAAASRRRRRAAWGRVGRSRSGGGCPGDRGGHLVGGGVDGPTGTRRVQPGHARCHTLGGAADPRRRPLLDRSSGGRDGDRRPRDDADHPGDDRRAAQALALRALGPVTARRQRCRVETPGRAQARRDEAGTAQGEVGPREGPVRWRQGQARRRQGQARLTQRGQVGRRPSRLTPSG